jgi:hypothetical protein
LLQTKFQNADSNVEKANPVTLFLSEEIVIKCKVNDHRAKVNYPDIIQGKGP